jgi:hypothetical protein
MTTAKTAIERCQSGVPSCCWATPRFRFADRGAFSAPGHGYHRVSAGRGRHVVGGAAGVQRGRKIEGSVAWRGSGCCFHHRVFRVFVGSAGDRTRGRSHELAGFLRPGAADGAGDYGGGDAGEVFELTLSPHIFSWLIPVLLSPLPRGGGEAGNKNPAAPDLDFSHFNI